MTFTWDELIDRARVYLDDDNKNDSTFIKKARMMTLFQVEYAQLYREWIRKGLIAPKWLEQAFTLGQQSLALDKVLAIVGVAESIDSGSRYRPVTPSQTDLGRMPGWYGTTDVGKSATWEGNGGGDQLTITLHPFDSSGAYVTRFLQRPDYVSDTTQTVELPYGGDERLVLGAAKRGNVKESVVSRGLEDLIMKADAEMAFTAFGRGNGVVVRRTNANGSATRGREAFPANPRYWIFY